MGADLTSVTPAASYKSLLQVGTAANQEITTSLKVIEDGKGNDTALSLAATGQTIGASFNGNVGINITDPDQALEVDGHMHVKGRLDFHEEADDSVSVQMGPSGSIGVAGGVNNDFDIKCTQGLSIGVDAANDNGGVNVFCINADGHVGINQQDPDDALLQVLKKDDTSDDMYVASFRNIEDNAAEPLHQHGVYISGALNGASATTELLRVDANVTARFKVMGNGSVFAPESYGHDLNGETIRDFKIKNDGQFGYDSSSKLFKTKISELDTSWLYSLNPVEFEYKKKDDDGNYLSEGTGVKEFGLIAEEVWDVKQEICYPATDGEKKKYPELETPAIGIDYKKLIPVLVKAVQELTAKVEALENA